MPDARDDPQPTPQANPENACALCGRAGVRLTRHHLLPQSRSRRMKRGKAWKRKLLEQGEDLREQAGRTAQLCPPCHHMVHATLSEAEIQRQFSTLEKLRSHPEIARFVEWVRRQDPHRRVSVRWTTERRNKRRQR